MVIVEITGAKLEGGFTQSSGEYSGGSQVLWQKVARTSTIDGLHFCHHDDVCDCLICKRSCTSRGVGKYNSGLLELIEAEFSCIRSHFK